jgi:hypothetical protein
MMDGMSNPIRHLALTAGLVALSLPAMAASHDVASMASPAGMEVEAWIETEGRLVIGITPGDGVKLNGPLGVAISAETDGPWSEDLPLLITGDGEYFTAPFSETISFDPAQMNQPTALSLEYGVCQVAMAICVFEETEITVHPNADGSTGISLTNVAP